MWEINEKKDSHPFALDVEGLLCAGTIISSIKIVFN